MEFTIPINEVFSKILTFFVLGIFGVIAREFGFIKEEAISSFTNIVLYITLPSLIFVSMTNDVKWDYLIQGMFTPIICIVLILIIMLLALFFGRLISVRAEKIGTFMVLSSMPNSGFLGFPIVFSIFGKEGLIYAILFDFGVTIAFFTIAIMVLRRGFLLDKSLKIFTNPVLIVVILGLIVNGLGIKIPNPLVESVKILGNATIPIIMLVIGYRLAGIKFKMNTINLELITISFVKLIFYPCIAYILLLYLNINPLVKAIIIIESAMPSMASTSVLVQKYGGDMNLVTTAVFFTTIMSIFSIPFILKFLVL